MVVAELTLSVVPVVLALSAVCIIVYLLALCVCDDRGSDKDPELTDVVRNHNSGLISPVSVHQTRDTGTSLDVETAITPLTNSATQNGKVHSRGNSVDLNKTERYSGASTGSSPRPVTINRELPDIPIVAKSQTLPHDRPHSHIPQTEKAATLRGQPAALDKAHVKSDHPHSQFTDGNRSHSSLVEATRGHTHLPEIPVEYRNQSPAGARAKSSVIDKVSVDNSTSEPMTIDDLDDYDHLDESKYKRPRPRSDYDHVVMNPGSENRIISTTTANVKAKDYKAENVYEGEVMVVPPVIPAVTTITVSSKATPKKDDRFTKVKGDGLVKIPDSDHPYNRIIGEDPYNKIRDDPYNRIKETDPYNRVKDDDPYNVVKGDADSDDLDPYNTVKDVKEPSVVKSRIKDVYKISDPYSLMDDERDVSNQSHFTDPYARVVDDLSEIDDPYNKVIDENDTSINSHAASGVSPSDDYATVNKTGQVEYAQVKKFSIRNRNQTRNRDPEPDGFHGNGPGAAREIIQDEYATVVKIRDICNAQLPSLVNTGASCSGANYDGTGGSFGAQPDTLQTPPEPPRGYNSDDSGRDMDQYNTQIDPGAQGSTTDPGPPAPAKKKDPPYTKLSARESLASMNARIASNTYEIVPERYNLYATVDGSSGDGEIRPKSDDVRDSGINQYYSEIPELVDGAAAPAPPSLDSLHETAKQHQDELRWKVDFDPYSNISETIPGQQRTPAGQGHQRTNSGQGHFRTPSSDAGISIASVSGIVPMATAEVVDLGPNYPSVEGQSSDLTEFDPNYETVEEAKSKAKYEVINGAANSEAAKIRMHVYEDPDSATKRKYEVITGAGNSDKKPIRGHVYEEVTITGEERQTRQRALNLHTYEDVSEVKFQHKGQTPKSDKKASKGDKREGQRASSSGDGKKTKSGHEGPSSGDQSRGGKRKFTETKEKGKDTKKKQSDGKEKDSNKKGGSGKWL